jgi:hypothetical protein
MNSNKSSMLLTQIEAIWVQCEEPVKMRGSENFKLQMPIDIPKKPGIYRLVIEGQNSFEHDIYVGEGEDVHKRLKDYENAGWMPGRLAYTNRRVQGWLVESIRAGASIEVQHCTLASIQVNGSLRKDLGLDQRYNRMLIENSLFSHFEGRKFLNKIARSK